MFRFGRLNLALALLLLLPTLASAQRDSRYTREATRHIGIAMTRQDPAQQAESYREALTHLREGMEREADNARVWLLAGTVLAALGEMQEADQAFTRAVQMHPEYAEEIAGERESAWIVAFNEGLELMDEGRLDEAIERMEGAQIIYNQRPEALMNLGALYANSGDMAKAQESFEKAIEATHGSLFEQIDDETREMWLRYREMAAVNVAQMLAARGVDSFNNNDFNEAETHFGRATELNPHSRDFWFNYLQAVWAQVNEREDALEEDANPAAVERARNELPALYDRSLEIVETTRSFDPTNEVLFRVEAQAKRMKGELGGTDASREQGQNAAYAALERLDALAVTVDNLVVYSDGAGIAIEGLIRNRKATEGTPVQIEFTFLNLEGNEIGRTTVTANAPATDDVAQFTGRGEADGELAGWRYVIR
ncbi:MAG TPA: tetratricopeptide repeat protein [Longimicrobiales bacterium]|nr:tetratricopeptide repeat protein [Longimicrobiales bacterium]